MPDFSFGDQILYGAGNIFDWNSGIYAMLVEQVDAVDSQPFQRCISNLSDALGTAVRTARGSFRRVLESELRCDDDTSLVRSERFADELLIVAATVNFGCI